LAFTLVLTLACFLANVFPAALSAASAAFEAASLASALLCALALASFFLFAAILACSCTIALPSFGEPSMYT
jgi:hypothetical protein